MDFPASLIHCCTLYGLFTVGVPGFSNHHSHNSRDVETQAVRATIQPGFLSHKVDVSFTWAHTGHFQLVCSSQGPGSLPNNRCNVSWVAASGGDLGSFNPSHTSFSCHLRGEPGASDTSRGRDVQTRPFVSSEEQDETEIPCRPSLICRGMGREAAGSQFKVRPGHC